RAKPTLPSCGRSAGAGPPAPTRIPATSCPRRRPVECHAPSTAAGTRRRAGSAPLGALRFPLVILAGAVLALSVLGLDKPRRLQALKDLVDVVVDLGNLQVLQRLGRCPATVGRIGQARNQGLPDDVEADVALTHDLEKG